MSDSKLSLFRLRPKQAEILAYTHGRMGISAVPGSGKTWTLSYLVANLLSRGILDLDQEILIVTLVNSAVNNFYQRVSGFVERQGLIPNIGYRVRTLHGLAHDIVHERPDLAGLDNDFQIIDEHEANDIRVDISRAWLHNHPYEVDDYLSATLDPDRLEWIRRNQLPDLIKDIALAFIRYAKDRRETPEHISQQLERLTIPLPLATMGCEIYSAYQRALAYRGAVDFDDLIRLALHNLESDTSLLNRLRTKWPYILEDEAQDSSALQEQILRILSGPDGNWVRVGDPNQAIYETFTTANPRYLREFLCDPDVIQRSLPNSGRSTAGIINLANYLVDWTLTQHPLENVRDALQAPPYIEPTTAEDPLPNPPDSLTYIRMSTRKFTPADEIQTVAESLAKWLPEHPDQTVAVLSPRNQRAFDLVDELRKRSLPYMDDFLRSSSSTRSSAGSLAHLLRHLADPQSASKLAQAFLVWRRADRADNSLHPRLQRAAELLRKVNHMEDFIWPTPGCDWLGNSNLIQTDPDVHELLAEFRLALQRWHGSIILPIDQLVLFLSQDILTTPAELAVAYKLAILMRQISVVHPEWQLPQLTNELVAIAKNERRFLGFSDSDVGFDPDKHPGVVIVSTLHKAKGLEWDRVYLLSVNNYDFPSGLSHDIYISEKWYLREGFNLEAETLAQLKAALSQDKFTTYRLGTATLQARVDYIRERLRLLYVGITRARKELIISWNTGRNGDQQPAAPLMALLQFLENSRNSI
jgi:DNA helicase-2/ATP-dependent DNA helicase PcrA